MGPEGLQGVRQHQQNHPGAWGHHESGFSPCLRTVPARRPGLRIDSTSPCPHGTDPSMALCSTILHPDSPLAGGAAQLRATAGGAPFRLPRAAAHPRLDEADQGKHSETFQGL